MDKQLAANIRRIAAERNVSQKMVAHMTGLSEATVSNYFTGSGVVKPSAATLARIASAIGVSVEDFFDGIDKPLSDGAALELEIAYGRIHKLKTALDQERAGRIQAETDLAKTRKETDDVQHEMEMNRKVYEAERAEYKDRIASRDKRYNRAVILIALLVLLVIVLAIYSTYCFTVFDLTDVTKGIYRG